MEKQSKQKGETKKVPPVYSEEKLKALETAVNWIRNRQVFLIRQIQKMISVIKNCRKLVISTKS